MCFRINNLAALFRIIYSGCHWKHGNLSLTASLSYPSWRCSE